LSAALHEVRVERWSGAAGNSLAVEIFTGSNELSVMLLHGGGQTRHTWRRAARRLQAAGTPCVTFDMRGHGDSDWIECGDYRLDAFLADLRCVLEQWRRPTVLIGASLGGIVGLMAAGERLAMLRGLVMIDTAPQLDRAEIERYLRFFGAGSGAGFESPAAASAHVASYFPSLTVPLASIERGLKQSAGGRWQWRWDTRVVLGEHNSVALPHEARMHRYAEQVSVPLLLVRAGASALVTDQAVERLRTCAPQLEIVQLAGAHHLFTPEESLLIVDQLGGFLRRAAMAAA